MIRQLKKLFFAAVAIATVSSVAQAQSFDTGLKLGFSSGYSIFTWINVAYPIPGVANLKATGNLTLGFADGNGEVGDNPKILADAALKYGFQIAQVGIVNFSGEAGPRILAEARSVPAGGFNFGFLIRPEFNLNAYFGFSSDLTLNSGFGGGIAIGVPTFGIAYSYLYIYNQLGYDLGSVLKGASVLATFNLSSGFLQFDPAGIGFGGSLSGAYQLTPAASLRLQFGYSSSPNAGYGGSESDPEVGPSNFYVNLKLVYKF
jgi:hypothetical protein